MGDSFYISATIKGVSASTQWDVLRLTVEDARKLFVAQTKGAWIVEGSGRTSDSKTFRRANVPDLRLAFENAYATPQSVDFSMRPTLGRAPVSLVSVMAWFAPGDPEVRFSAMGSDRIKVETFARELERALTSSRPFKDAAPEAEVEVKDVSVMSDDSKRAVEVGGAFFIEKLVLPILVTVIGGLILSVIVNIVTLSSK